ncbi:copper-containing nitrite reductase [Suttonella ornithocola]|uniref:Copper-containing nitrite reductase n=1 Tax=Suttonella ornithocola TaxID=279832 RepID=A0A380MLF2_9GAMM|nr:copper-containing nitrite reductase [Suttonella ornithocola]SUO93475.1 Copper-containing nitrite reductase precursor [Suttonella ornithocola]
MHKLFLSLAIATLSTAPTAFAQEASTYTGGLDGYEVGVQAPDLSKLEHVKQTLVTPPNVPEHSLKTPAAPRVVQVEMTIQEKEIEVEPGVFMWAFTFNGSVPGPLIVVHEGDYVELTLKNPTSNILVHNIDFHASTGALGGGDLTHVAPGQEVVLRFKATKPGIFVYHCAPGGAMIPWHVVHGMNGAIVVLPKDGLKDKEGNPVKYDKAFYIGEQDFYIPKDENGNYKRYSNPAESYTDDQKVMDGLIPTHVVFGESKGQLTGDNALHANVGDTVMIYHSQANRASYPHLIGGHGEYVWERGNLADKPAQDLESWVIGAGSAGAAMYKFKQPGTYVYLSHNLIEALDLGALAQIRVDGKWNNDLMEQVKAPSPINEKTEQK